MSKYHGSKENIKLFAQNFWYSTDHLTYKEERRSDRDFDLPYGSNINKSIIREGDGIKKLCKSRLVMS